MRVRLMQVQVRTVQVMKARLRKVQSMMVQLRKVQSMMARMRMVEVRKGQTMKGQLRQIQSVGAAVGEVEVARAGWGGVEGRAGGVRERKAENESVRGGAVKAIGQLGNVSSGPRLAAKAAGAGKANFAVFNSSIVCIVLSALTTIIP